MFIRKNSIAAPPGKKAFPTPTSAQQLISVDPKSDPP